MKNANPLTFQWQRLTSAMILNKTKNDKVWLE